MVFIGNINQSVETLVKTSHLLAPVAVLSILNPTKDGKAMKNYKLKRLHQKYSLCKR